MTARATCPGSEQPVNAFPGEDVCPVCQRWVRVRRDSTIGKHPARKAAAEPPHGAGMRWTPRDEERFTAWLDRVSA